MDSIASADFDSGKKAFAKLLKQGPFNNREKLQISLWHSAFGENDKALKVLGDELSKNELEIMSESDVSLQARLAFLLHTIGARYSSLRIMQKLSAIVEKRNLKIVEFYKRFYLHKIIILRTSGMFEEAINTCKEAIEFYKDGTPMYGYSVVNYVDCLNGFLKFDECLKELERLKVFFGQKDKRLEGHYYRSKGVNLIDREQFQEGLAELEKAKELFPMHLDVVETAVLHRYFSNAYVGLKEFDKAKEHLEESKRILMNGYFNPTITLCSLYFLEELPDYEPEFEFKLALRAHPAYSVFSYLAGKRYFEDNPHPMTPDMKKLYKETDNDCWRVTNGTIEGAKYEEVVLDLLRSKNSVLDLYAGLEITEGQVQGVVPEAQMRALDAIIGAGALGVNKWALVDILYREEDFHFKAREERLKNLVNQLKKKNHTINRKKNFYYYEFPKDETVYILPMRRATSQHHLYLKACKLEFSRRDVEELFNVHKATANRWISTWREEGIIESSDEVHKFI